MTGHLVAQPGAAPPRPARGWWARWAFDLALAGGLTAVFLLAATHIPVASGDRPLDALGYALVVLAGVSMAAARRRPDVVVLVIIGVLATYFARQYPDGPVLATGWIALVALGRHGSRRVALAGAALMCVVLTLVVAVVEGGASLLSLVFVGWSAAAVFLGDALRNRRSYLTQLEEHAHYLARTRDEEARRRVAEDRLRIARDLHDSVAHAMATISVQAGAAAHVIGRRPQDARAALVEIQRASSEVLTELAGMVALLREQGQGVERAPAPGLDQIHTLVADARGTRLTVAAVLDGPTAAVPAAVGTAAYRIVQESLTNVVKHSGAANAWVEVHAGGERALVVQIRDDGRATSGRGGLAAASGSDAGNGTGSGLRGMRERAESTGGRLFAGPADGGGFVVRATWDGVR